MKSFILIGIFSIASIAAFPSLPLSESGEKEAAKSGIVESLDLSFHNDNYCGGTDAYIELIQGSKSCITTKHRDFDKGTIVSWTGIKLGSCLKKEFNIENDKINFKVRSTDGDDFCPKTLQININNTVKGITREVIYKSDGMNDWVDKNKGGHLRATKRTSDIDLCKPNPCQNNGICMDEINKYTCNCSGTGFDGKNCEQDINECLILEESGFQTCQNGGKCINEIGNFSCDCQKGWEGNFCDRDKNDCQPINPCPINATCFDNGLNDYICECPKYWEGDACDIPQSKFAVKEVSLKVDPYSGSGGCGGGETTVQIQINVNTEQCITKPLQFPTGQKTYWITEDHLKDCAKNERFDHKTENMTLKILPTDKNEWYCINSLSVILDDENNTVYRKDTDNDWKQGEQTLTGIKQ